MSWVASPNSRCSNGRSPNGRNLVGHDEAEKAAKLLMKFSMKRQEQSDQQTVFLLNLLQEHRHEIEARDVLMHESTLLISRLQTELESLKQQVREKDEQLLAIVASPGGSAAAKSPRTAEGSTLHDTFTRAHAGGADTQVQTLPGAACSATLPSTSIEPACRDVSQPSTPPLAQRSQVPAPDQGPSSPRNAPHAASGGGCASPQDQHRRIQEQQRAHIEQLEQQQQEYQQQQERQRMQEQQQAAQLEEARQRAQQLLEERGRLQARVDSLTAEVATLRTQLASAQHAAAAALSDYRTCRTDFDILSRKYDSLMVQKLEAEEQRDKLFDPAVDIGVVRAAMPAVDAAMVALERRLAAAAEVLAASHAEVEDAARVQNAQRRKWIIRLESMQAALEERDARLREVEAQLARALAAQQQGAGCGLVAEVLHGACGEGLEAGSGGVGDCEAAGSAGLRPVVSVDVWAGPAPPCNAWVDVSSQQLCGGSPRSAPECRGGRSSSGDVRLCGATGSEGCLGGDWALAGSPGGEAGGVAAPRLLTASLSGP